MQENRSSLSLIVVAVLILLIVYVGSYFVLVRTKRHFVVSPAGGVVRNFGDGAGFQRGEYEHYIICPSICRKASWPLEQVDRRLRKEAWRR